MDVCAVYVSMCWGILFCIYSVHCSWIENKRNMDKTVLIIHATTTTLPETSFLCLFHLMLKFFSSHYFSRFFEHCPLAALVSVAHVYVYNNIIYSIESIDFLTQLILLSLCTLFALVSQVKHWIIYHSTNHSPDVYQSMPILFIVNKKIRWTNGVPKSKTDDDDDSNNNNNTLIKSRERERYRSAKSWIETCRVV